MKKIRLLALDAPNRPQMIYREGGGLFHWSYNGAWWINEFVGSDEGMTSISNIVDTSSQIHLVWKKSLFKTLSNTCCEKQGGHGSVRKPLMRGSSSGEGASIALDADQHPRISFYRYGDRTLRYRAKEGANWHASTLKLVDTRSRRGRMQLAGDRRGWHCPHLLLRILTNQAIRYARRSGSVWGLGLADVVAVSGEPECRHSLALKSNGWPGGGL